MLPNIVIVLIKSPIAPSFLVTARWIPALSISLRDCCVKLYSTNLIVACSSLIPFAISWLYTAMYPITPSISPIEVPAPTTPFMLFCISAPVTSLPPGSVNTVDLKSFPATAL